MEIVLTPRSGSEDGLRVDLPLDPRIETPVVVDATRLGSCHPMFALRLRLFVDWHRSGGRDVTIRPPTNEAVAQRLADLGVASGLPAAVVSLPEPALDRMDFCLPVRTLRVPSDVDDVALQAEELMQHQAAPFGSWATPSSWR